MQTHPAAVREGSFSLPSLSQDQCYQNLKYNIDDLRIIQLRLTLSDASDNLPILGNSRTVWQLNFSDFNSLNDASNPDSLDILLQAHPTFDADGHKGVPSSLFGKLFMSSGVVCNRDNDVNWVTYHSASDFVYLVKIPTGNAPPETKIVNVYFGERLYDMKYIQRRIPTIKGPWGLDGLAEWLGVHCAAWQGHQADSDSLLTMDLFQRIRDDLEIDFDDLEVIIGLETHWLDSWLALMFS